MHDFEFAANIKTSKVGGLEETIHVQTNFELKCAHIKMSLYNWTDKNAY